MQSPHDNPENNPSLPTLALMVLFTYGLTALFAYLLSAPRDLFDWSDASGYSHICDAIFNADFHGMEKESLFWGLPYFATALRLLVPFNLDPHFAVALTSLAGSLTAILLACKLWGTSVASAFALLSIDWIQRSVIGGPEPLCMALVFGAFWMWRGNHWKTGALLAALATTVRPLAVFALISAGALALKQRDYRRFAAMTFISLGIGAMYALPLLIEFDDPLLNYHNYQNHDWDTSSPIGIPFASIVAGMFKNAGASFRFAYSLMWFAFLLLAVVLGIMNKGVRNLAKERPIEWGYALLMLLFTVSYNSTQWSWEIFPRLMIMMLPFLLIATGSWWPRRQVPVWLALTFIATFAGASIANTQHSMEVVKALATFR